MKQFLAFLRTSKVAPYAIIGDGEVPTNTINALVPEWWALEGLMVLEESLIVANLVNKDYNNYFVNAGDTVNINKPGTFEANLKLRGVDTTIQDASATPDTVKLNQHIEVTFAIDDREMQKSMVELRSYFLVPAIRAIAEGIDSAVVGEGVQFAANAVGELGVALDEDTLIDLGRVFDDNNVPPYDRYLVVGPSAKADLLRCARFTDADKTGQSSALLNGQIGHMMGFDIFMSQTVGRQLAAWAGADTTTAGALDGAVAAGATAVTVDGSPTSAIEGCWATIAGVPGIYQVSDVTGSVITFTWALKGDAANDADVTVYPTAAAVKGAGFTAASGAQEIITDGYAAANLLPQVGQGVSFGTSDVVYTITKVSGTWGSSSTEITIKLNRPLDATISNGDKVYFLPAGGAYNLAFRPDALTLVNRPLTPASAGVVATVQNNGAVALRVTIGYDQRKMMHAITVDTLLGVKVLDPNQGAILLN